MAHAQKPRRLYFQKYFEQDVSRRAAAFQKANRSDDILSGRLPSLLTQRVDVGAREFPPLFCTPLYVPRVTIRMQDFIPLFRPQHEQLTEKPLTPHVILLSEPGTAAHRLMREFAAARHDAAILPLQIKITRDEKPGLRDVINTLMRCQDDKPPFLSFDSHDFS